MPPISALPLSIASSISVAGVVLALYYLVLSILALYGLHRLVLLAIYFWTRNRNAERPPDPAIWPRVTVQLPVFNERYVATRLIDSVCALDYPRDRLEIQVLDDSTDDTQERVAACVARYQRQGFDITHLHRDHRAGYKAGALAAGCQEAKGDLLAIFDADFVPPVRFLRQTVPYFADPAIGVVQARWDHVNRDYSLLTRAQAIFLDAHFKIEHLARNRACENQAFAMGHRIVGLQYHLETTPESVSALIEHCRHELVKAPYVQTETEIQSQPYRFRALNLEMDRLLDYFFSIHRAPIVAG